MKNLIITAIATALVVPAIPAMAKDDHRGHQPSHAAQPHAATHQFKRGEKFDRNHATNYRQVDYRSDKRLKAPPRGQRWVRSGHDALLVNDSNGVIQSIIAGLFR